MEESQILELTSEEIVLAGLEGTDSLGAANKLRKTVRSEVGASRFRKHMLERVHMLPRHVQKALRMRKAQISDAPYYSTAPIKGTRAELIKLSQPEEIGITNIDNGKLGKDRFLVLSGIKLLYEKQENGITGYFNADYPAQLLNGEWELELNGRKVFEKMPVRSFHDGIFGYNTDKAFGLYLLNNPKMIEPQTPVEFNVSMPDDQSGFLKVFFLGTTIYSY